MRQPGRHPSSEPLRFDPAALLSRLRDPRPNDADAQTALTMFAVRAHHFWDHPYFTDPHLPSERAVVLDSLAFRLRPLMLSSSDDVFLWSILTRLETCGADPSVVDAFRGRAERWYGLTADDVGVEAPPLEIGDQAVAWILGSPPLWHLLDYIYGLGVHSDTQRVMRSIVMTWTGTTSPAARRFWSDCILGLIEAARPLIVDAHNEVLSLICAPGSAG